MNMQEAVKFWPHEVTDTKTDKKGVRAFYYEPVTVTVKQIYPGEKYGLKFNEDTNTEGQYKGVIWNLSGQWNEQAKSRDPYDGFQYQVGDRLEVGLRVRSGDSRNFYDIAFTNDVTQAPAQPPQQPDMDAGATSEPQEAIKGGHIEIGLTLDQRIAKSQAWNGLTAVLVAVTTAEWDQHMVIPGIGLLVKDAWVLWADGFEALKAGRVPFVQCPHTDTLGVAPPEGGFSVGDPTETCQACGEGVAPYTRQPEHESGSAPAEDDWEPVPGRNE